MHIYKSTSGFYLRMAKLSGFTFRSGFLPLFIFFIAAGLHAQVSQTVYFMDRLPQSSLVNPAFQHHHNFHLLLPAVSSFNVNAGTNFLNYNDIIFKHHTYDSLITFLHPDANTGDFTSGLNNKRNSLGSDLHINILSLGFRARRSFISFSISERFSGQASLPGDLIKIALEGNQQFVGRTADFSGFGIDLNYFREYAAGYSYMADEVLSLGIRAKMLYGKSSISSGKKDISLYTDPETYNMRLRSDFTMNVSMPGTVLRDEEGNINDVRLHFENDHYDPLDFVFNSNNSGFGVDLGATYRLTGPLMLYASVTDIGFINWKHDVYNFSMNGEMEFEGIDLSPLFDINNDSEPDSDFVDTLRNRFRVSDASDPYRVWLPAKIYVGGTYDLTSGINMGLLSRSVIYQGNLRQAVTVSANASAGRWLSASMSYSVMNNSFNNFGMGLSLRGGGFQLYVISDNLNAVFYPHRAGNVNLWVGLNIVFGHVKPLQSLPSG
jgi:hypothetical protein